MLKVLILGLVVSVLEFVAGIIYEPAQAWLWGSELPAYFIVSLSEFALLLVIFWYLDNKMNLKIKLFPTINLLLIFTSFLLFVVVKKVAVVGLFLLVAALVGFA